MIKLQNITPEVYYKQSRDFQFVGRLYDLIMNSVKTNIDTIYSLPISEDSPEELSELLALTLGFKLKHNYTAQQLKIFCTVIPLAMRNKGSINALIYIANALIKAEGCSQAMEYSLNDTNTELNLYLPPDVKDTTILNDLIAYILPAGMSCNIIKQVAFKNTSNTDITTTDKIEKTWSDKTKFDNNDLSGLVDLSNSSIIEAQAKDTYGILANNGVYKPFEKSNKDNEGE